MNYISAKLFLEGQGGSYKKTKYSTMLTGQEGSRNNDGKSERADEEEAPSQDF
jgi:hypothetical protein